MTSKKKEAVTRDMIGEPFHFRHTTHVYKDSEDSFFKGVPAKWREAFADSSRETGSVDEGDRFKLSELLSSPGLHTLKTKRDRIEPLSEENDFNLDCLKGFRSSNIFYESPFLIINHISVVIDNGSWGILYGSKKGTKQVFVFKFHRLDQKTNMKFIRNEIEFHSECSHINIVDFVEAHIWDQSAILTFTSNREIPLYDLIQFVFSDRFDKEDKRYNSDVVGYIISSIASGLSYIHSKNYIHGDIKSDNIQLSADGVVKISEFGICRKTTDVVSNIIGSPYWMAPEVARGDKYGVEVDIWSLGCVMIELCTGEPPLYYLEPSHVIVQLKNQKEAPFIPVKTDRVVSPLMIPFMELCFLPSKINRASADHLLIHPFLSQVCEPKDLQELLSLLSMG